MALVGPPDHRVCSLPRGDTQLRKSLVARLHPQCNAKTSSLSNNFLRTRMLVFCVNELRRVGNLYRFLRVSVCVHPRKGGLYSVPELAEKMKEIVVWPKRLLARPRKRVASPAHHFPGGRCNIPKTRVFGVLRTGREVRGRSRGAF